MQWTIGRRMTACSITLRVNDRDEKSNLLAVNAAIEAVKASTQNMAGTRQAETAARNLHEMSDRLKQLLGKR